MQSGFNWQLTILLLFKTSSAEKAGIKVSDRILSIDGHTVQNKSVIELQALISGTPGSVVPLVCTRASIFWGVPTEIKVDLTRELPGACVNACRPHERGERSGRRESYGSSSLPPFVTLRRDHD